MVDQTVRHEFTVEPGLRLVLADLSSVVRVRRGEPGAATVGLERGDERYGSAFRVRYDASENLLEVREDPPQGAVNVTVAGGGVVVGPGAAVVHGVRSRGTTTVATGGAVAAGATSVVGAGSGVSVVSSGGRVVVNGVDVTEQVSAGGGDPTAEPPVVTVVVPEGTDVGADRCLDLTLTGLRGRVRAQTTDSGRLVAEEATGARLTAGGQSSAELRRSTGPVTLRASGQARVTLDGDFGDVGLELSGQAGVTGSGSYGEVTGHASGMSRVHLAGPATGGQVTTSGMASVRIGGPAPAGSSGPGDDWNF